MRALSSETAPPQTTPDAGVSEAAATTGASVARGGLWSAASNLVPQFFVLAVSIAGARFLGPSGLGRQSFIAYVVASTQTLLALGVPLALMRTVGQSVGAGKKAEARGLVAWTWRLVLFSSLPAFGVLAGAAVFGAEPRTAWILAAATAAVGVVTAVPGAVLSGLQRWRDISIVTIAANGAGAAITILVLAIGGGITGMIAVQLGVAIAILVAVSILGRRRLRAAAPVAADPGPLRRSMLRYAGSALAGSLITLIVFRRSEFFFLEHYADDREVALYSVSFAAVTTLVLVPQALAGVVSPAVATLYGAGQHERIRTGYGRTMRLLLVAALPVTAGALALGPETIRLVFGSGFAGTKVPLLLLLVPFPLIPLMNASYSLIVGLGKIRFPLVVGAGSAALNIGLDFALIPHHAAVGAAIANGCAQGATALATILYGARLAGPVRWEPAALLRAFVASVAAGGVAWVALELLGGVAGVVVGVVSGVAAFTALAAALRILSRDDAGWFERSFGGRIGVVARRLGARV
ncbi:MAG TPA: oligosaccharide flippase family protein [Gaiellaceae bacterium]|nr:oligosaccharide flippase family protein [Gaiellaceae bacterium]